MNDSRKMEAKVFKSLSESLNKSLSERHEKIESREKYQSDQLSEDIFANRARAAYIEVLLKEISKTQEAIIFTSENHIYK